MTKMKGLYETMKKTISIILCMAIACSFLLCSTASAAKDEPFTLRNGIQFGDTIEEVKEKEKELTLDGDVIESADVFTLEYKGTIAGAEGEATFYFDKENKTLTDLQYEFTSSDSKEIAQIYNKIKDSCNRKYGDALSLDEGNVFTITGKAIEYAVFSTYLNSQMGNDSDIVDYGEWVVYGEDGNNVKIENVVYYNISNFAGSSYPHYYVVASYHYFTQEELDSILNEKVSSAIAEMNEADSAF